MNKLKTFLEENRKWLVFSLIAVFIWGLLAHGYCFANSSFSHDSLNEFNGADGSNLWKVQLGRFLAPVYRAVFRTNLTLPWLVGMLSLIWIALAVFLVIRLFDIRSKLTAFLLAGIFTANLTVTATASTYLMDCDYDMFAMLCAVAAAYLWRQGGWKLLPGAVLIAVSLGIYQSYISVAIVLVMFVCILDLLNEKKFLPVLISGLKAIGMLAVGGILYFAAMKAVLAVTQIPLSSGDYHSLDKMLELTPRYVLSLILYAYVDCANRLFGMVSPYSPALIKGMTAALMLTVAGIMAIGLANKRLGILEKLLCAGLVVLVPLGMNIIYIPTTGVVHDLMVYAIWLFYLLALLLTDWLRKRLADHPKAVLQKTAGWVNTVCMVLVAVLLYSTVQTANALYLKKDLEQDAFLSMMTRVLYRMEDFDEYVPGQTPVTFTGDPEQLQEVMPGFETYRGVVGATEAEVTNIAVNDRCRRYFTYILHNPAVIADEATGNALRQDPRVAQMPSYPDDGCLAIIDGVLVVKLG